MTTTNLTDALQQATSQNGENLLELTKQKPTLLIFLRHEGCSFCREAAVDIKGQLDDIRKQDVNVALVHLGDEEEGKAFFSKYGLEDVPFFSDTRKELYKAFGLKRMSVGEVTNPTFWKRAYEAAIAGGHGVGTPKRDPWQLPGVFLLKDGEILREYRHESVSDRPDYVELSRAPQESAASAS